MTGALSETRVREHGNYKTPRRVVGTRLDVRQSLRNDSEVTVDGRKFLQLTVAGQILRHCPEYVCSQPFNHRIGGFQRF